MLWILQLSDVYVIIIIATSHLVEVQSLVMSLSVCSHISKTTRPNFLKLITSRMRHSRGEMYIVHSRLLSVCLYLAAFPHYCTDQDVTWVNGRGCPLVVHFWVD